MLKPVGSDILKNFRIGRSTKNFKKKFRIREIERAPRF